MADDETKEDETKEETNDTAEANALIDKANAATERMEKANEKTEALIKIQEKMKADEAVGGKTDAGSKEMSEDEKIEADAKKLLKGTGFEEDLFPEKK